MNSEQARVRPRFPRLRGDVWQDIPRLDLSKVQKTEWLIDSFLARGSTQLVWGSYGTNKTTAMLLAGWAVSRGREFLGKKTRQCWTLYLDYENPVDAVKRICEDLSIDPSGPAFTIWDRSAKSIPVPGDDSGTECLRQFVHHCKKITGRCPWIIFDSWTSLLKAGESGDKIGDATPIFRAVQKLRDEGCTITIIDHTGKHGKDPIGTSAKMTQMDTFHSFKKDDKQSRLNLNQDGMKTVIRVESHLKRYAPKDVGTFSFELLGRVNQKGEWHIQSLTPTKDKSESELEQKINHLKKLILKNPMAGQEEIAKKASEKGSEPPISRDNARSLLQDGIGKYWEATSRGHGKLTFRVL